MKEEKEMKIKGIKKAVGDYNKWTEQKIVYFDTKNLEVWTNIYPSGNVSWSEYRDENIAEIDFRFLDTDKITMVDLKKACIYILESRRGEKK